MAREFICLYFSWLETGATLTDEEFGRMCRAGLQYGLDGTEPDLPGNDKILFPVMKWQVDRDVSKFDEICQKRREAGSRGGKSKSKQSEANQANATFAKQNEANQANASNTKKKTKTNTKTTMSEITYDVPALLDGKGFIAVNDPACGAGALLLSFANICKRKGINYQEKVLFVAQDIDYTVGLMCYIQLSLMGCAGYVVIGDTLINPCTAYDKKGLLPAGDPERIWFTPLFSDGIWYGRRLAAQMDLLISGSSRKSPENVNSFTEKPEKVADLPAKDTKKSCSFTEPAKAAARVSTPVSTEKVETWKPAELNETKNGQLTFF